jgi:ankyrin repeat protein
MLLQVSQDRRDMVGSILRWVTLALRPLTLRELATAIDIEPVAELDIEETTRQYTGLCGYFLKVTGDRVGLVHQSAKDYLLRDGSLDDGPLGFYHIKEGEANAEIARTCFTYLNNEALKGLRYDPWDSNEKSRLRHRIRTLPLLDYAFRYWIDHARKASTSAEFLYNLSHPFYAIGSPTREAWFMIYTHSHLSTRESMLDSLIHFASRLGLDQMVLHVLEKGNWRNALRKPVDEDDKSGRKPLYYAAKYGHVGVLELLLNHKANVNGRTRDGNTALHTAARYGRENIVRLLLANPVDIHATNRDGETALHIAAEGGHSNIVQILLKQGAGVDAKDSAGRTAFMVAARHDSIPVMQMLLEHHANLDIKDQHGMTVLHRAAKKGDIFAAKTFLDHLADIEAKDKDGQTALHWAAVRGEKSVVRTLLQYHANIEAKDESNRTALHTAAKCGHVRIVRILLKHHADMEAQNTSGETALHLAVDGGHSTVAQVLLRRGAKVSAELLGDIAAKKVESNRVDMLQELLIKRNRPEDVKLLERANPRTRTSEETVP